MAATRASNKSHDDPVAPQDQASSARRTFYTSKHTGFTHAMNLHLPAPSDLWPRPVVRTSPVVWANFGVVSRLIARCLRPARPPLLVLSLPRCGSTWVGSMLGLSRDGLYLHEPLNLCKYYIGGDVVGSSTVFMFSPRNVPETYRVAARDAFNAVPAFSRSIVRDPSQWRIQRLARRPTAGSASAGRRVVIKCVNPLALRWLCERYRFDLVLLVRHPAAVAASWHKMGWTDIDLQATLGPSLYACVNEMHKQSFWTRHGALQALTYRFVFGVLEDRPNFSCRVVQYETICREPGGAFGRLFHDVGFTYDEAERRRVREHSRNSIGRDTHPYSTFRESTAMTEKWKQDLSHDKIRGVKRGFCSLNTTSLYRQEAWT